MADTYGGCFKHSSWTRWLVSKGFCCSSLLRKVLWTLVGLLNLFIFKQTENARKIQWFTIYVTSFHVWTNFIWWSTVCVATWCFFMPLFDQNQTHQRPRPQWENRRLILDQRMQLFSWWCMTIPKIARWNLIGSGLLETPPQQWATSGSAFICILDFPKKTFTAATIVSEGDASQSDWCDSELLKMIFYQIHIFLGHFFFWGGTFWNSYPKEKHKNNCARVIFLLGLSKAPVSGIIQLPNFEGNQTSSNCIMVILKDFHFRSALFLGNL